MFRFFFISEIMNDERNAKHVEAFQLLFLLIPPPNRTLLQSLLELLSLVVENPRNLMTAHNLALVFSPNIMTKKTVSVTGQRSSSLSCH